MVFLLFMQLRPPLADDTGRGAHVCCLPSASAHTQSIWHRLRHIINRWLVYISHLHRSLIHFSPLLPHVSLSLEEVGDLIKNPFRTECPKSLRQRTHDYYSSTLWLCQTFLVLLVSSPTLTLCIDFLSPSK